MNVSTVWCQEACWVTGFSETGGTNTCYTRVCLFTEMRWSGAVRSPQGENIAFEAEVPIFVQPAAGGKKLEVFRYEKWSKRLHEAANYRKNPHATEIWSVCSSASSHVHLWTSSRCFLLWPVTPPQSLNVTFTSHVKTVTWGKAGNQTAKSFKTNKTQND